MTVESFVKIVTNKHSESLGIKHYTWISVSQMT